MKTSDFDYPLDESRIAQFPINPRDNSKLLIVDRITWNINDINFNEIIDYLDENSVIVFNETKVIKARLKWYTLLKDWRKKEIEIFLLSQINSNTWECSVFPGERLKPWKIANFEKNWNIVLNATIKEITYSWRIIEFNKWGYEFLEIIDQIGDIPLPPYIEKNNQTLTEYNTVFAKIEWSSAAPTAWLHFTQELIDKIIQKWVKIEKIILHIWLGTFKTITVDNIEDHHIHSEKIYIDKGTSERLNKFKAEGKKIISVWTTVCRTLESFTNNDWKLEYWEKNTNIFIYPWYKFKYINELITNFHLPKSSLLMLVSAFYSREKILETYSYALENNYRFMSFWDSMRLK